MMSLKLLFLVLLLTKLAGRNSGEYASLALSKNVTRQPSTLVNETYCAVYNSHYVSIPRKAQESLDARDFHEGFYLGSLSPAQPEGCVELPSDLVEANLSLIVERGNCTFYRKALLAQRLNASMLLVVYNETVISTPPSLAREDGGPPISIPVLFVSNETGEEIKDWVSSSSVYLSAFVPPASSPIDPGSVLLFCIAVGTVLMAAFLANMPFQFLRYGLLFRKGMEFPPAEEGSGSKTMGVVSMLVGLVVMIVSTCALLLLLYFFYSPVVYIVLALYCVGSFFGLYSLLSPFVALIPLGDRCRVPPNKLPVLKYQPNILFFLTVLFCACVVTWWGVERHSTYAWVLQDILGFAFITMLLSRLRFLKVWFVAVLLLLLFIYDIFMVFITPYFTHDGVSVMEKAATGPEGGSSQELLPVVFLVPKLLYPSPIEKICSEYIKSRPASLLGYGDVGIPGLLVTLCYKFDLQFRREKCFKVYYATCGIAYTVGLAITYLALTLMQTAQPALLYLVPTTLGSVTLLSLFRKEFTLFFTNKLKQRTDSASNRLSLNKPAAAVDSGDQAEQGMESETEGAGQVEVVDEERRALISGSEDTKV